MFASLDRFIIKGIIRTLYNDCDDAKMKPLYDITQMGNEIKPVPRTQRLLISLDHTLPTEISSCLVEAVHLNSMDDQAVAGNH